MHGSDSLPSPRFKYYCKICRKGFGCGRALGGHMRAHGIGYEADTIVQDEVGLMRDQWDVDKLPAGKSPIRHMYALRTNPNRLKSCRVCENRGEEFTSWKSFLEHGKCTSDAESLVSSDVNTPMVAPTETWAKGRRSERVPPPPPKLDNSNSNSSADEEDIAANCLVMLSSGRIDHRPVTSRRIPEETDESCTSATKDYSSSGHRMVPVVVESASTAVPKGMFQCKACKKVFNSHQALGGHRASHKKVKGCYAKVDEQVENYLEEDVITHDELPTDHTLMRTKLSLQPREGSTFIMTPLKKKPKLHECSICHRRFETGQALGGHKRCHWVTSSSADAMVQVKNQRPRPVDVFHVDHIDLNLPASADDHATGRGTDVDDSRRVKDRDSSYIEASWLGMKSTVPPVEDEVESRMKIGKLRDLNDLALGNGCSPPWLQVGIGSSNHED